jgi:hypothetical protein
MRTTASWKMAGWQVAQHSHGAASSGAAAAVMFARCAPQLTGCPGQQPSWPMQQQQLLLLLRSALQQASALRPRQSSASGSSSWRLL